MSFGQKARHPGNYPRMKVRGAARRRMAPFQRMNGRIRQLGEAADSAAVAFQFLNKLIDRHEKENNND